MKATQIAVYTYIYKPQYNTKSVGYIVMFFESGRENGFLKLSEFYNDYEFKKIYPTLLKLKQRMFFSFLYKE